MADLEAIIKGVSSELKDKIEKNNIELEVKLEEILAHISAIEKALSVGKQKSSSAKGTPRATSAKGGKKQNINEYFKNKYILDDAFRKDVKKLVSNEGNQNDFKKSFEAKSKPNDSEEKKTKNEAAAYWTVISAGIKSKTSAYKKFENNLRDEKSHKEAEEEIANQTEQAVIESDSDS